MKGGSVLELLLWQGANQNVFWLFVFFNNSMKNGSKASKIKCKIYSKQITENAARAETWVELRCGVPVCVVVCVCACMYRITYVLTGF